MFAWFWANITQISEAVALAMLGGGAVAAGTQLLLTWLKNQLTSVMKTELASVRQSVAELKTAVETIQLEFQPNGGNSMRDQVMFTKNAALSMLARQWALVDQLGDPMWEADAAGVWTRVNKAMLALTQRSQDQLAGTNWENAVHFEDRGEVWDGWSDAVARKRTFEMTFRLVATSRQVFRVDVIATPIVDAGVVTGWLGKLRKVEPLS